MKAEREAVTWLLPATRPAIPCAVQITRVAPSNGLDGDNLQGALKAIRDAVAQWLQLDDRDPRVTWAYDQRRGKGYAVEVRFA